MADLDLPVFEVVPDVPSSGAGHSPPARVRPLRTPQVTAAAAARLPRQSLSQTRQDLIKAASLIVNEYLADGPRPGDPPVDPLPFVRLDEVLDGATALAWERLVDGGGFEPDERVAPLTAGAFYKAFADDYQEAGRGAALTAFRRVVLRHMIESPLITTADLYIGFGKQMAQDGKPWSEVVRLGVVSEFMRWEETPALMLMSALAFHARDREVGTWAGQVDRKQLGEVNRIYEELLPVFRRQMRPGVSIPVMAMAVSDLIGGMVTGARFDSVLRHKPITIDVGDGERDWHPCALAAWSIYDGFTEPIPDV